jgi:lysophospholipase L1-like esterase
MLYRALILLILLSGCEKMKLFHAQNKTTGGGGCGGFNPTSILWVGDSIVKGEAATNQATLSYAGLVSIHFGATRVNIAEGGAVVKPGYQGAPDNGLSMFGYQTALTNTGNFGDGNYVYVAFGTNDIQLPIDPQYKVNLKAEIEKIIAFGHPADHIIIGTAPYQSARPHMPGGVAYMEEIADELGCLFFNVYAFTAANGGDSLLADGIHPTNAGHDLIADAMIAYLESL